MITKLEKAALIYLWTKVLCLKKEQNPNIVFVSYMKNVYYSEKWLQTRTFSLLATAFDNYIFH